MSQLINLTDFFEVQRSGFYADEMTSCHLRMRQPVMLTSHLHFCRGYTCELKIFPKFQRNRRELPLQSVEMLQFPCRFKVHVLTNGLTFSACFDR